MKRILLIIAFVAAASLAVAGMGADLEFGYDLDRKAYLANVGVGYRQPITDTLDAYLFTGVDTRMHKASGLRFQPFNSAYFIGASITWDAFTAEVYHKCVHPVWSEWSEFYSQFEAYNQTTIKIKVHLGD